MQTTICHCPLSRTSIEVCLSSPCCSCIHCLHHKSEGLEVPKRRMSAQQGPQEEPEKKVPSVVDTTEAGDDASDHDSTSQSASDSPHEQTTAVAGKSQIDMTDYVTYWASIEAGFLRGTSFHVAISCIYLIFVKNRSFGTPDAQCGASGPSSVLLID
jgi:hypothetical protein